MLIGQQVSEPSTVPPPQQAPSEAKPEPSQSLTNGVIPGLEGPGPDGDGTDNSPTKKILHDSQERTASPLAVPNGNGQVCCSVNIGYTSKFKSS